MALVRKIIALTRKIGLTFVLSLASCWLPSAISISSSDDNDDNDHNAADDDDDADDDDYHSASTSYFITPLNLKADFSSLISSPADVPPSC